MRLERNLKDDPSKCLTDFYAKLIKEEKTNNDTNTKLDITNIGQYKTIEVRVIEFF